jgi:hypothetical protein
VPFGARSTRTHAPFGVVGHKMVNGTKCRLCAWAINCKVFEVFLIESLARVGSGFHQDADGYLIPRLPSISRGGHGTPFSSMLSVWRASGRIRANAELRCSKNLLGFVENLGYAWNLGPRLIWTLGRFHQTLYRFVPPTWHWHFWHFSALEEPITYVESTGCKVLLPPPPPYL